MQNTKPILSTTESVCIALNQRKYQEGDLFSQTDYWKLSDIASLYPNYFDIKSPISENVISQIYDETFNIIPEFKNITPKPLHIVQIKTPYKTNLNTDIKQALKNTIDQKISRIAWEYLFRQIPGTEIQQAYFMYPHKNHNELLDIATDLRFERIRNQTIKFGEKLASITNHSLDLRKPGFSMVWTTFWCTFFNQQTLDDLRIQYSIKKSHSVFDHMKFDMLAFINKILHEIVIQLQEYKYIHFAEIINKVQIKASIARTQYINKTGQLPESDLICENTYPKIEKLRQNHKMFLQKYYPISLNR